MIQYTQLVRRVSRGRKSEIYSARSYDDASGRRGWRSTGQKTLREAKREVEKWRRGQEDDEPRSGSGLSFKRAVTDWLTTKETRASAACLRVYRSYVSAWKKQFNCTLERVTTARIERYFAKRAGELSGRSMNNERSQLKAFFVYAVDRGWAERNPMKGVAKFGEEKRAIRILSPEQEGKLLAECKKAGGGLYPFVLCMIRTALRRATVARLRWEHVDFESGTWEVPAEAMKSREDFFGRPIAEDLLAWIRKNRKPAGKIFGTLNLERFRASAEKAKVPWLTPHTLRRHWLTRARRAGVELETAMWLGDWRDVKTVLNHYRLVDMEDGREATRAMLTDLAAQSSGGGSSGR